MAANTANTANMAAPASLLMNLPLEVRHAIFEYAATRDAKPKKLLRYWFEKQEVKELMAKSVADNSAGSAPVPAQDNESDGDSDSETTAQDTQEEQDSSDEDGADQYGGDSEDEEQCPHETQFGGLCVDCGMDMAAKTTAIAQSADADAATATHSSETAAQDTQHEVDQDGDSPMAGEDGEGEGMDDQDGQGTTDGTATAQAPVIRAHRKWRHIPNFMRLTHTPPPSSLLLTSKQLNAEAKNWFYDVAILRISATNSFAHTSFFEEAFSQITDAAFSPMDNIRNVEVMFVWDTTWLRAEDTGIAQAVFPALLRQRADFVHKILSQAPDLKKVIIHYHDSAHDDESMGFMLDVLSPFHDLNATVKIEEHYIAVDAKPRKSSIAGKQRVQFQHIVDAGIDRLF